MRKNLFVSIALLTVSAVCLSAKTDVNDIKKNDNLQSILIRPDANRRLKANPDEITGIKAALERMQAPSEAKIEAQKIIKESGIKDDLGRLEAKKLQNKAIIEKQKNRTAYRRAQAFSQTQDPLIKVPFHAAAKQRPSQWNQPYNANGENNILTHVDRYYNLQGGEFKHHGYTRYTYDEDGIQIKSETKVTNSDSIVNLMNWYAFTAIPVDAIIRESYSYSDTLDEEMQYYIDPAGVRHELGLYREIRYDGYTYSRIHKVVDKDGNLIDGSTPKIVTEFDSKGRISTTIEDTWHYGYDKEGYDTSYIVPYRKTEYTYPDDNTFTTTTYEWYIKKNSWVYDTKETYSIDNHGRTTFYEYYLYNADSLKWYGDSKYTRNYNYNLAGSVKDYTHINYAWDEDKMDWVYANKYSYDFTETYPSGLSKNYTYTYWVWDTLITDWHPYTKRYDEGNPAGYITLRKNYSYSDNISAFYLTSQQGYDFIGDTCVIGNWYIYYKEPKTIAEQANQDSLFRSGYKYDYEYYTDQEVPWLSEYDEIDELDKATIRYNLDSIDNSSPVWTKSYKLEWEYKPVKPFGSDEYEANVTVERYYEWENNDWVLYEKYLYNDYGDVVQEIDYSSDGTVSVAYENEYLYEVEYYGNDSSLVKHRIKRVISTTKNGQLVPYFIEKFDLNGNQTFYQYYSSWNDEKNNWSTGYKYEQEYDAYGNATFYCDYSWDLENEVWIGNTKEISAYNRHTLIKREIYDGRADQNHNTVWIPYSYYESFSALEGSIISYYCYAECHDWNETENRWEYAYKLEVRDLLPTGKRLESIEYMNISGEWVIKSKIGCAYNANGDVSTMLQYSYDYQAQATVLTKKIEYTYTQNGDTKDILTYDGNGTLTEKKLAVIENDKIIGYVDSVYREGSWRPYSKVDYIYSSASDTIIQSYYLGTDWHNSYMEVITYNATGNKALYISYNWDDTVWIGSQKTEYAYSANGIITGTSYYWNQQSNKWEGDYKTEIDYDALGNEILDAYYEWDYDEDDWRGDNKTEFAYDNNGNLTLQASYYWSDDEWNWVASYKYEFEYDDDGNEIMFAYYSGVDESGDLIGISKYYDYIKDSVEYYENYYWDANNKEWCGSYKRDFADNDSIYLNASYAWNNVKKIWYGTSKYEYLYDTGATYNYDWDKQAKTWVGDYGLISKADAKEDSTMYDYIYYKWENSKWVNDYHYTRTDVWNNDDNMATRTINYEDYDAATSTWKPRYGIQYIYIYSTLTNVENIPVNAVITVSDGAITVEAQEGTLINIASVSGSKIAAGNGTVSASVVPGIYLITIGNKTTKVLVR